MASSLPPCSLIILFFLNYFIFCQGTTANQIPEAYVVYMGSSNSINGEIFDIEATESSHLKLLSSILPSQESERLSLVHTYNHGFKGFSAVLTDEEAAVLSDHDEIVSIFADTTLELHTTRSWDFLESESGIASNHQYPLHASGGEDVIIGIIDTGIWPESPSFNDNGIGKIPSRWNGVCMEGSDFKKSDCNRKLIGARYYDTREDMIKTESNRTLKSHTGSPRDSVGHGTHTASTAAGAMVPNASYYGLGHGTAKGGSPSSRLAIYKACSLAGCSSATILKAMDDAIKDGVDIISISIGVSSIIQSDFLNDPIAIGAFHANEKGIMVVCAGGNDGPDAFTVVNSAPWIMTVAASNIDRAFRSNVVLGNGQIYHGSGINFSNMTRSKTYPIAFAGDVASTMTPLSESSNCYPGSLDLKKAAGKIIVCVNTDPMVSRRIKKLVVESAHAKGIILINEAEKGEPFDSGVFPFSEMGDVDGAEILKYINTTKYPTVTILPTVEVPKVKPAPVVASFSSRGPGGLTETILKPDVAAPGVAILAAMIPPTKKGSVPPGKRPSKFAIKSGTSMACPHVAGTAAFIKSIHPDWSTSMIKSALMTTAIASNNNGKPLTNSSNAFANPHEMGAGEMSPLRTLNPGLVFETTTKDYLHFLCYYGYKQKIITSVSGTNFTCPSNSIEDFISDINYPSISISQLEGHRTVRTVTRTVTNVGQKNATYVAKLDSPRSGLIIKVSPEKLVFTDKGSRTASFKVSFYDKGLTKGYKFGSVTWSDQVHFVRVVFAVNVV
ncbi:CO(2)-response secreted protease-like [Papaver somniferum]|uniref:CO(2)-response secreted protease-like n=1 Tax=Papaver somniferum TaxID=3469 RepID=UPI000E6F7F88|nr:CO(2)-response secreted protease-like [Papaver somniferum]